MKRNSLETIMGAFVLLIAISFAVTAYQNSGIKKFNGYNITASFDKIDGINVGSDVRIGGIKIGTVTSQTLDPQTYQANLTLNIKNEIKLPADSTAEIVSESLLGGKYINLVPGADDQILASNGHIEYTQSSINLEQMIGKFAFGSAEGKASDKEQEKK